MLVQLVDMLPASVCVVVVVVVGGVIVSTLAAACRAHVQSNTGPYGQVAVTGAVYGL